MALIRCPHAGAREEKVCAKCRAEEAERHRQFWEEIVREDERFPERAIIVDGAHFSVGPEDCDRKMKGYGGTLFEIHFFDGRVIQTTNLNYQGAIPKEFADRLADNARRREVGRCEWQA